MISLLRDVFEAVGLNLYLFPYGVLPTDYERGIIEVGFPFLVGISICAKYKYISILIFVSIMGS